MSYGTKGLANYHPEVFGPVAHWTLGSTLESTFGSKPLVVEAGTERYSDLLPGVRGFYFDGSTNLLRNTADVDLQITGDMTFLCLMSTPYQAATTRTFLSHLTSGETEDTNALYIQFFNNSINALNYLSEHGAGLNDSFFYTNLAAMFSVPIQIGFTRLSGQVQFYLNGLPTGAVSVGLTTPSGGSSGRLRIGSDVGPSNIVPKGTVMASPILFNKGLSALQVKQMYNQSLGPALGLV